PQGPYEAGTATARAILPHTGRWALAGSASATHPFQTPSITQSFAGAPITHTNSAAGGGAAGHMNISHFHTNVATHSNSMGPHANSYNVHVNVVGMDTLRPDLVGSDDDSNGSEPMAARPLPEPL